MHHSVWTEEALWIEGGTSSRIFRWTHLFAFAPEWLLIPGVNCTGRARAHVIFSSSIRVLAPADVHMNSTFRFRLSAKWDLLWRFYWMFLSPSSSVVPTLVASPPPHRCPGLFFHANSSRLWRQGTNISFYHFQLLIIDGRHAFLLSV